MSVSSSPNDDFMELLGRRNMTIIPKDQQSLLDKENCWAVNLKTEGNLLAHVPPHVLKSVEEAYQRTKGQQKQKQSSRSRSNSVSEESESDNEDTSERLSQAPPSSSPPLDRQDVGSSPERSMSWSCSPERQEDKEVRQSSPIHQTPPPPPQSPVRPASQPRYSARSPVRMEPFPSSYEPEELEVEVPQGHTDGQGFSEHGIGKEHKTKAGQSVSTPTCAQPDERTIPATVVHKAPEPSRTASPAAKPTMRRMKRIKWSSSPEIQRRAEPATVERMAPAKNFAEMESSNMISSSYIPATFDEHANTHVETVHEGEYVMEDAEENAVDGSEHNVASVQSPPPEVDSPMNDAEETQRQQGSEAVKDNTVLVSSEEPTVDLLDDPFAAFSAHYPDYRTCHGGTLDHFVRACICLQYMLKNRLLRDRLYDDFIRAWSSEFWSYAHHEEEPLPAAEWYNSLGGDILYNRWLVKQDNLEQILVIYKGEVSKIMPSIETKEETNERKRNEGENEVESEEEASAKVVETEDSESMKLDQHNEQSESPPPKAAQPVKADTPVSAKSQTPIEQEQAKPRTPKSRLSSVASERHASSSPKPASRTPIRRGASSAASSSSKSRAPSGTVHPYLQRLASRSSSSTSKTRSEDKLKKLHDHFRKRNSSANSTGRGTPR